MKPLYKIPFVVSLLSLISLTASFANHEAVAQEYTYDVPVQLKGRIVIKPAVQGFPIPVPKNKPPLKPGIVFILELTKPITVIGNPSDPLSTETEKNVTRLQMIDLGDDKGQQKRDDLRKLLAKKKKLVVIQGELLHAHTAFHKTRVLLIINKIPI